MNDADIDLTGKVAIVTGASRGIGRAVAIGLAERGAAVVGTARSLDSSPGSGGTLRSTMEAVESVGVRRLALTDDITDPVGVQAIVDRTVAELGRIDMLMNNAGVFPTVRIVDQSAADWEAMLAINLTAPFLMCRAVLPVMAGQGSGNILNVSSGASIHYRPEHVAYSATKAAINRFSVNLAEEVRDQGIAVNAWMPGLVATDMTAYIERGVEPDVVVPSAVWSLAQSVQTFTGQVVERTEFGVTWGPPTHRPSV